MSPSLGVDVDVLYVIREGLGALVAISRLLLKGSQPYDRGRGLWPGLISIRECVCLFITHHFGARRREGQSQLPCSSERVNESRAAKDT